MTSESKFQKLFNGQKVIRVEYKYDVLTFYLESGVAVEVYSTIFNTLGSNVMVIAPEKK